MSAALAQLASAQLHQGAQVEILTPGDEYVEEDFPHLISYLSLGLNVVRPYSRVFLRHAWNAVRRADVIHLHALWLISNWVIGHVALAQQKRFLITPHGMLDPWALRRSALKKRFAMIMAERRLLRRAACFHALCETEARQIRALGAGRPIVVVPHGIDIDEFSQRDENASPPFEIRRPYVLFLGRLHPKKGLELLVKAWNRLGRDFPAWQLVIAGPDEARMTNELHKIAEAGGRLDDVVFTGPVHGQTKVALLRGASIFTLPSHSEGVPVAVLEALACEVPVVITQQCNLDEVATAMAGRIGEPKVESVVALLQWMMSRSDEERREMGKRGRNLIQSRFQQEQNARQLIHVYEWMLGSRGDRNTPVFF